MTITANQYHGELVELGIPPFRIAEMDDAVFMPMQSSWLLGGFHRWYFRALEAFDIRPFADEAGDCDDFTGLFCSLARIAHRRTPEGKGTALPVRRFNFARIPSAIGAAQQRHAIVIARTSDLGLIFVEPQVLGRRETLTPDQIQSCTKCSE